MGGVEHDLIVGVGVDRGHNAGLDGEGVVEHLDDGGQAVGGAGGVREDVVLGGVVFLLVDAEDEGEVFVGGGCGDDDFLYGRSTAAGAAAEVGFGLGGVGEEAGGFDDDFGADGGPVELGGVALGEDLDLLAVDGDGISVGGDVILEVAEDGVVLEEVGEGGGGGEVVDGDELDLGIARGRCGRRCGRCGRSR